LQDEEIIRALYRASQAGVSIDLIVRGICCLRPGLPGVSENIRVRSIVDRLLEHSRILRFENGGNREHWIGSADWMPRNLDRRVEVMCRVRAEALRERLDGILDVYLRDDVKAREILPDGKDVKESRDLPKLVAIAPVGKDVDVVIVRKGKEITLKVKLGRLEDGEKQASLEASKDAAVTESPVKKALGMEFLGLNDEVRGKFQIKEGVKGVVVSKVNPGSAAAEKGIQPGMVIDEIGQKEVAQPADVASVVNDLRKAGKKSALLRVVDQRGEVRFVAIAID